MPISPELALDEQGAAAESKLALLRVPGRYLVLSALAGAFIGIAVVLMIMVSGPLNAVHSPWTKLIQGAVFAVGLVLVIFSGGELVTSTMMTAVQGAVRRRISPLGALALIVACFVGNLIGSIVFAWLVHKAGVLNIAPAPGAPAPGATLLEGLLHSKLTESGSTLFFRGVLCNFLVCLTVWMGVRTRSDAAKIMVIFWGLLAFVSSGFEHVVANMTTFSLGLFEHVPGVTVGAFAHNMLFVGLGNLVGGGLLVGVAYAYTSHRKSGSAEPAPTPGTPVEGATPNAAVPAGRGA
ncbi:formate/nitrite transporter family protein [Streptomyces sp. J2-1]|uniref:formate/nitrite transporter family protein n=1 Tax=Streptomyces corallincola TaxID=2851888 RepID=UPI001C390E4B|nr:formate/nitrite transporter family protein [Streptomyces corallincola]MBV2357512.1 formate/nitrite transporter family protein [Streptomyces corallincola]